METYLVPMWVVECGVQRDGCISMVKAADAQATVEALQAIIKQMGEQAARLAKDGMAAKAQVEALQARVSELEAIKIPDDAFTYCAYCGEKSPVDEHNEDLSAHIKVCLKHPMRDAESQLTQRTAELEAANTLLYKKNCALGRAETSINDLQAELERVRSLVEALPKVEGEVAVKRTEVDLSYVWGITLNGYFTFQSALFDSKEEADAYAAILKHRQGMEG